MKSNQSDSHWVFSGFEHAPLQCKYHTGENVQRFCESCGVYVCFDCVVDQHCGHNIKKFQEIMQRSKEKLKSMTKSATNTIQNDILKKESLVEEKRGAYRDGVREVMKDIISRAEELKGFIDAKSDTLVEELFIKQSNYKERSRDTETRLTEAVNNLNELIIDSESVLINGSVKEMEKKAREHQDIKVNGILCEIYMPYDSPPMFISRDLGEKLETIFGYVQEKRKTDSGFIDDEDSGNNCQYQESDDIDENVPFCRNRFRTIRSRRGLHEGLLKRTTLRRIAENNAE